MAEESHCHGSIKKIISKATKVLTESGNPNPEFKFVFHSFRHTYSTVMLTSESVVDIPTLSKLLGHARESITLDVYGHVISGREKEVVANSAQSFNKYLGQRR